ncbi:hypothetical protein FA10DRAFT_268818 [Acaromyces ingoldii]|uniref:stearoyl-CoA 9-desaturase n=1 Tax=Acaromyces ingoldii TaxID=215250 RepID=A0A316YIJ5_9BASI|nr:hypothetical protein FA10DRAFT_268818 [Acaromyces ingoldii]PWN88654.1 hypothetical protein FA10DRAFT_268818 [Acaromyces ingoldii]
MTEAAEQVLTHRKQQVLEPGLRTPPTDTISPPQSEDESSSVKGLATDTAPKKKSGFSDGDIPDDYVTRTLEREPALPPVQMKNILGEIQWVSFTILTVTPLLALYGIFTTHLSMKTFAWSVFYYFFSGLGITAGYHRLWAHRSYVATRPLEYLLALMGTSAVQGSIHWWARGHRAHHRYTDTDLDPYGAHHGLLWSHLGWMIVKPRRKPGVADISDLRKNPVIKFQHKLYLPLILFMGFILPTIVAGFGWNDWRGGFYYAAVARLVFVHHSTFCVNSLAHWLGEASFDNKMTPRDHFITALVTVGEGYHNFHHQFPMDYRNAVYWHQYDPTKWFIATMKMVGLATHLKKFPDNEVQKGRVAMSLQKINDQQSKLSWPKNYNDLPVISWDDFQEESKTRPLIVIHGFIHDVSSFMDEHPGGRHLLAGRIGKDATVAFNGGLYAHSNAAHNLLSMMRVGVLDGGYQLAIDDIKRTERARAAAAAASASVAAGATGPGAAGGASSAASTATEQADGTPIPEYSTPIPKVEERNIDVKARSYVPPGQVYTILKRGELKANSVAQKNGGKVGRIL